NSIGGTILSGNVNVSGNLISANGQDGVALTGGGVANNTVRGNFIGTDVTGTTTLDLTGTLSLGNKGNGVTVSDRAHNNMIGGTIVDNNTAHLARNIIAGNGKVGVHVLNLKTTTKNLIQGNYIGTDLTGTVALANNRGVAISGGAVANTVGGTIAAARNLIPGHTYYRLP